VAGLGHPLGDTFGLDLGCQHLIKVGPYVLPCLAYVVTSPDCCQGALDSGVVCVVIVVQNLGEDVKIPEGVIGHHVLHNHPLYCSIKVLNLPIAAVTKEAPLDIQKSITPELQAKVEQRLTERNKRKTEKAPVF